MAKKGLDSMETLRKCPRCGGHKHLMSPEWEEWWSEHKHDWLQAVKSADGIPGGPEESVCTECHGSGAVPMSDTEHAVMLIRWVMEHYEVNNVRFGKGTSPAPLAELYRVDLEVLTSARDTKCPAGV